MVKIALLQLPLQSHDYVYSQENIPLAAGYLAAYLSCMKAPADVMICPERIMNLGGDAAIMHWIEDAAPDIVGFSCYLWNVERTLHLCGLIRQRMEKATIVFGGPEVTPDNGFLLAHGAFHFGVVGEGEETFHELVCSLGGNRRDPADIPGIVLRHGQGWRFTGARPLMTDPGVCPSPFISGIIGPSLRGTVLLETVRGCPMRCAYCYYHKSAPSVRTFPIERAGQEISWASGNGVGEITIIDPCFARRPGLDTLLSVMAGQRSGELCYSCELNAEDLTEALVGAMAKTGLVNVEIGLQSTNARALRNVGRLFNPVSFTRGVRMLRSAGMRVMTDIMVGLPGDGPDDVKRSVDFVLEQDLCDELSVYPLSVLPGTVLRDKAHRFGIGYQHEPPYLVTSCADMTMDDIRQAFAYVEEVSDRDLFPVELPRTQGDRARGHTVSRIVLEDPLKAAEPEPHAIGQALCIDVRHPAWMDRPDLGEKLRHLLAGNPYTLVSWIVPEGLYRGNRTLEWITSTCGAVRHPSDREYMSPVTPIRSRQLFLKGKTVGGRSVFTMIPLDNDRSLPLWAALPAGEGPGEERVHRERMGRLLGYLPKVRYRDLEDARPDALDGLLGTRVYP